MRYCKDCGVEVGKSKGYCEKCRKERRRRTNQKSYNKKNRPIKGKRYCKQCGINEIGRCKKICTACWKKNIKSKTDTPNRRERNWKKQGMVGATVQLYNQLLKEQNNCCAICGKQKDAFKKRLAFDHNHQTGKVRGLLCSKCNSGLGNLQDDIKLIVLAVSYLRKYEN